MGTLATVSLATVTLQNTVTAQERHWTLDSTASLTVGQRLFHGQELVAIEQINQPVANVVVVRRGVDGTVGSVHPGGATLYVGRGDQFYTTDPVGTPPLPMLVYPYINVVNGQLWTVYGDDAGPSTAARVWTRITTTLDTGALGVRTTTTTIPT